jgi:glyoxylase-like metal-dependent hydrolase (beta-lactamase superfamily II)
LQLWEEYVNSAQAEQPYAPGSALFPRQVHTITDRFSMTNTYLLVDERLVVVDPGSEQNIRLLHNYLARFLHLSPTNIDLIVLTHLRFEHSMGIEALRRTCKAQVAASVAIRDLAARPRAEDAPDSCSHSTAMGTSHSLLRAHSFPTSYRRQEHMVDMWLKHADVLPGHPNWRVVAGAGPMPESICLYNPVSAELLSGDTLVTSEGGALLRGNNQRRSQQFLRALRALRIHYLYPAHGRALLATTPLLHVEIG